MIEKDEYALGHVNRWIVRGGIVHGTQLQGNWAMVYVDYSLYVISSKNIMIGQIDIRQPWNITIEVIFPHRAIWITKDKHVGNGRSKDYVQLTLRHGLCSCFRNLQGFPTRRGET